MLTREQRLLRSQGLGGSDMNALAGGSHRKGWRPIDVYMSKVEPKLDEHDDDTSDQKRGKYLESGVRLWYADEVGAVVTEPGTLRHDEMPLVIATPDGVANFPDKTRRGVEIKCPRYTMLADWCDGDWPRDITVPSYYMPQLTWEAAVLGVPSVDMAVLLGDDLHIINVPFDKDFFEDLYYIACKFWRDFVVPRRPPPPDTSESYQDYLRQRYPKVMTPKLLPATPEILDHARGLHEVTEKIKQLQKNQCEHRAHIQSYIGDALGVDLGDGAKITWKNNKDSESVDYKTLVGAVGIAPEQIAAYTAIKPGPRVFRTNFKGW